jgi:HCOMODA/2-hydroxy-3-carboxy-muconic semialdehyde decarboxylase
VTLDEIREQVALAARTLARHGLVTAFGHVSARVGDLVVITPPIAPGDVTADALVTLDAAAGELPAGTAP